MDMFHKVYKFSILQQLAGASSCKEILLINGLAYYYTIKILHRLSIYTYMNHSLLLTSNKSACASTL
jgi:hypothetical protein